MCLCVVQIWRRTYPPRGPLGFHFPPLIYEDFTSSKVKSCRVVKSLWAGFHKKYWKKWNSPERGAYDAKFERHITKYGWKQLKMSWFYVISYNLGLCRLVKRSKAASKTGQILLKNTNIGIETPCKRAVHTEIWNIWEIDCIFRPKPCHHLFIEITLVFHIVYDPWSFQVLILTISPDRRPKPLTHLTGCKIGSVGWK